MFQLLILTFISLAHQQTPQFNISKFNDPKKLQQIYYLTQFMALEKSLNLTTQKAQENANFALELWVNTEHFLNQTSEQKQNKSILNIVNNQQFQNIIPQDQKGLQETQIYLDEWQNQTDDNKSIILQYVVININEMIQTEDPAKYNKTNLIEHIHNQTQILDYNQKNINTSKYISPFTWQHANVSQEEMMVAHFFENAKSQNLTLQEEFNKLSFQEAAPLINAFEKFYNNSSNNKIPSKTINSKGEQPTDEPQELLPEIKSKDSEDHQIYLYVVLSLAFILLIVILFFLRRWYIHKNIISFQMNEESNTQGLQP